MTARFMEAGEFRILTYGRGLEPGRTGPVHVYLEGDGRHWRGRRPPRDPTPRDPMGLRLAARDPAPSTLWLARPCMYGGQAVDCDPVWWTSHRYASEVVEALDGLITRRVGNRPVRLLGHSGGGALAALIAARRSDVQALITVAAPLDLDFWAEEGRMTPLWGSLNPVDVASRLGSVPQRHFGGARDEVVSTEVVRRFVVALPPPDPGRLVVREKYDHHCCWAQEWPRLAALEWLPRAGSQ